MKPRAPAGRVVEGNAWPFSCHVCQNNTNGPKSTWPGSCMIACSHRRYLPAEFNDCASGQRPPLCKRQFNMLRDGSFPVFMVGLMRRADGCWPLAAVQISILEIVFTALAIDSYLRIERGHRDNKQYRTWLCFDLCSAHQPSIAPSVALLRPS